MKQHLQSASPLACGLHSLPSACSAFAATQAAWRFFHNDRVGLPQLIQPLLQAGRDAVALSQSDYALLVHDWSSLHYYGHSSKQDQAQLSHAKDRGYELATALLVDAELGSPLAPLEMRLRTAERVFSSCSPAPTPDVFRLDQLRKTMAQVAGLKLAKKVVHVIDAEADSLAHLRDWDDDERLFLVRSDGCRRVRYQGKEMLLSEVAALLEQQEAFRHSREVTCKDQKATQHIASAFVVLDRPAQRHRARGRGKRQRLAGKPLTLRLVVSRVVDEQGKVLAVWLLLTNVPDAVSAACVALWYYWRWRIESYFKLLKSAGQELENWQQESGEAIAKRLLVASMACVVVWGVARAQGPDAVALRALLVRLSGRQMKRGVEWTAPALLAGVWVLVAIREAMEQTPVGEMLRLAEALLPPPTPPPKNGGTAGRRKRTPPPPRDV